MIGIILGGGVATTLSKKVKIDKAPFLLPLGDRNILERQIYEFNSLGIYKIYLIALEQYRTALDKESISDKINIKYINKSLSNIDTLILADIEESCSALIVHSNILWKGMIMPSDNAIGIKNIRSRYSILRENKVESLPDQYCLNGMYFVPDLSKFIILCQKFLEQEGIKGKEPTIGEVFNIIQEGFNIFTTQYWWDTSSIQTYSKANAFFMTHNL